MSRQDNKVEMDIIKDMKIYSWDRQRKFIKKIYPEKLSETPPLTWIRSWMD